MQRNKLDKTELPENRLLLYVSDQSPDEDWHQFAVNHNCEMLYHDELLAALGAFIMLMPGIVVIDRRSAVGNETLSHIEDVLHTIPQPLLILIELGVPDCMARYRSVVRLGASSDASPAYILTRLQTY
ncbi:hypothetical protein HC928_14025 [bacterium]|nr:hypothetical protein [bacterium]